MSSTLFVDANNNKILYMHRTDYFTGPTLAFYSLTAKVSRNLGETIIILDTGTLSRQHCHLICYNI